MGERVSSMGDVVHVEVASADGDSALVVRSWSDGDIADTYGEAK